jgi:RNA polymerase sigma-70 factor (ECF subfamily)
MPTPTTTTTETACPPAARFERFRPRLTLLARVRLGRRLRGKVDPDDLVQETFLAAVAAADDFRGKGDDQTLAWLRAILESRVQKLVARYHTAARDVRRERPRRRASPGGSTATDAGPPADQSTPSRAAQRREYADLVADALAALPPDYREVLVLRNIEGLSFPEIADRLGRAVGAVTMLWARAVRQFRLATPDHS